jgi:hypothetical protein
MHVWITVFESAFNDFDPPHGAELVDCWANSAQDVATANSRRRYTAD